LEHFKERDASWLENFYDLIIAIVVLQLSINLNHDVTLTGFASFVALFIPVCWLWIGVTFYSTRFGTDDMTHRFLTLLQIGAACFMAVNIPDGLGKNAPWFALSYAISRGILVIEYIRAGRHVPSARSLTYRYSIGFSIAAGIWLVSAFVPSPFRFVLWIIGMSVDICTPILFTKRFSAQFAPHIQHLPERFGSFTIIVLGIAILGVVDGIATHEWTIYSMTSAALGLTITFSLWWIYFETVDGSEIRALQEKKKLGTYVTWLYIHFPLIIGFTALGVGVEHLVLSDQTLVLPISEIWLMCSSTSICLFALGVIQVTSANTNPQLIDLKGVQKYREGICSASTAVIVLLIGPVFLRNGVLPVSLMAIMAGACLAQVILDIRRHPHHHDSNFQAIPGKR
jgi:low temperature requirement protein LtrA